MKRIIISILILIFCFSGALIELFSVKSSVNSYLDEIKEIDSFMLRDDFSSASDKCGRLESGWSETLRAIDAVLIHDYVDQISINLAQMKAYIDNSRPDMYFASSNSAKKALESVRDSEYPLLENVL